MTPELEPLTSLYRAPQEISEVTFEMVHRFQELMNEIAPFMEQTVPRARARFGETWEREFDDTLRRLFGDDAQRLRLATRGYVRFALDAIKLQKRFERERAYGAKTYAEAAQEVYHNREYMETLYLPGILLSHYLWPHHYGQLCFYRRSFLPALLRSNDARFGDVGTGTGFYSRQTLASRPDVRGKAFDISEHSAAYARFQVERFGVADRWELELRDVVSDTPGELWPFLVSVEVLEHLEDPISFLRAMRRMLRPGGRAFITAAITAPNADHIYLYNGMDDVRTQLEKAGFVVVECQEDIAYEPTHDEPVPRLGAFIVT